MEPIIIIWTILVGAGSGLIAAAIGYWKSMTTEIFDINKFIPTILIGAVVGGIMVYRNIPYDQGYLIAMSVGAIAVIENASKAIIRKLREWWSGRKPQE